MQYNILAETIHENAKAKGFWPPEGRNLDEMLMLVVSELAEALEEDRDKSPLIYLAHTDKCIPNWKGKPAYLASAHVEKNECRFCGKLKPEGAAIEIADGIIRCLDTLAHLAEKEGKTVEQLCLSAAVYSLRESPLKPSARLFNITRIVCRTVNEMGEVNPNYLAYAMLEMEKWLNELADGSYEVLGCNSAQQIVELKMEYNGTRPFMHGKAY